MLRCCGYPAAWWERMPPRSALWLLKHFASARYRESLAGDLIEQCARGRSRGWCWRQVLAALALAPVSAMRSVPWMTAVKAALLALGLITLGVNTLSWASDSQDNPCGHACAHAAGVPER
jgi:hypothetical protein